MEKDHDPGKVRKLLLITVHRLNGTEQSFHHLAYIVILESPFSIILIFHHILLTSSLLVLTTDIILKANQPAPSFRSVHGKVNFFFVETLLL